MKSTERRDGGAPLSKGAAMKAQSIDYNAHILIGIRLDGTMTVLAHWPSVPRQSDVQQRMTDVKQSYARFALCTPTSIMSSERP